MQQTTNQPSPTTQPTVQVEAGSSRKGKGKGKSKGKSIAVESENADVPQWWTPEEEYALMAAWCATSNEELRGNGMKKGAYWGAVLDKFHAILRKNLYRNNDMLSSKWGMITKRCSKFNGIYNRIAAQQQSGTNEFDLFKAAKEQYRVEMGHVFDFEKSWELLRADPKWNKTPTSSEVQSKRSRNSSSVDVSDARTNIDLNADDDEIPNDIQEISPPRRPPGRDKARRAARHAEEVETRAKDAAEMRAKFDELNLLIKEKNELKRRHLEFLESQAREKREQKERELMTQQLSILRTSKDGLAPADLTVLQAMKEQIRKKYLG
ncbi:uncharacterized protein LOC111903928 [Lactuca sativa]|uniref:uncharacterized protein LOC111903928 n=1 Tax=Lactuca sativa TaxID=4236 RepID=UPI000CD84399|nr:uncharacterized protein LOC111903928 [Lactuca sativa]